jgi:predicted aspartyl protease
MMFLLPGGPQPENPWKDKVHDAVERAQNEDTIAALRDAFDVIWRADDWPAGAVLADQALRRHPGAAELRGLITRALWRAGRIPEAEALAAQIKPVGADHVALRSALELSLARGQTDRAARLAARLERLTPHTAEDLYQLYGARFALNKLDGVPELLRQAEKLTDPRNGYPESFVAEAIEGVADFLAAVGPAPLNQVAQPGAVPMPPLVMLNLPSCEVFINGRGPYRMIVDTGGSIMLALDQAVADEIGLKSIGKASVRGVSGKQETGQVLVDELHLGTIKCRRVIARTFNVRGAVMNAADGVLGTGLFWQARMTLDFAGGQLVVSGSGDETAAGAPLDLRIVSDAKLMALVKLEGQPAVAMLDTGADAVAVAPSRLKQLFPDRKVASIAPGLALGVGSDQMPKISLGSGVKLEIAGRTYDNYSGLGLDVLDDVLSPAIGVQTDILLGMPLFRDMKSCTVDFPKCQMWIDWLPRD